MCKKEEKAQRTKTISNIKEYFRRIITKPANNQGKDKKHNSDKTKLKTKEYQEINNNYQKAEQKKTNYWWATEVKNVFFKALGIKEMLERIDSDIEEYLKTDDELRKQDIDKLIRESSIENIQQYITKITSPDGTIGPVRVELQDVFDGYPMTKEKKVYYINSDDYERVINYIDNTNGKYLAYADDGEKIKVTISFIEVLCEFVNNSLIITDNNACEKYRDFKVSYSEFNETVEYKKFLNLNNKA